MEARGEEELTKKKFIERVLGAHRIGEKAGELGRNLDTSGRPGGRTYKDSSEQEEVDQDTLLPGARTHSQALCNPLQEHVFQRWGSIAQLT